MKNIRYRSRPLKQARVALIIMMLDRKASVEDQMCSSASLGPQMVPCSKKDIEPAKRRTDIGDPATIISRGPST